MKALFWLLLLANVILFALIQRGGLWWAEELLAGNPDEPVVQTQPPLHEDKIRLLEESPNAPVAVIPTPATGERTLSTNLQLSTAISSPSATRANTPICIEWGDFSGAELKLATAALSALQLGNKLDKRQVEQVIGYWVYIPPLASKADVNQKVAQLKARGVGEYFIVQSADNWHNSISLGVFKTQEAAQNFLQALRSKGVRSAQVGERAGKHKATIFILNDVDHSTEAKLVSMQKEFRGSELRNVPCTLTR